MEIVGAEAYLVVPAVIVAVIRIKAGVRVQFAVPVPERSDLP